MRTSRWILLGLDLALARPLPQRWGGCMSRCDVAGNVSVPSRRTHVAVASVETLTERVPGSVPFVRWNERWRLLVEQGTVHAGHHSGTWPLTVDGIGHLGTIVYHIPDETPNAFGMGVTLNQVLFREFFRQHRGHDVAQVSVTLRLNYPLHEAGDDELGEEVRTRDDAPPASFRWNYHDDRDPVTNGLRGTWYPIDPDVIALGPRRRRFIITWIIQYVPMSR